MTEETGMEDDVGDAETEEVAQEEEEETGRR